MNAVRDIDILKTWLLSDSLNFTRYFFKSSGVMVTGWALLNGRRYFFTPSTGMAL